MTVSRTYQPTLRALLTMAFVLVCAVAGAQFVLDWNRIGHWVGSGDSRAAMIIQFNDGHATESYVWGYRWDSADGAPTSRDILMAIACEDASIDLFTQFVTADGHGETLAGILYSPGHEGLSHVYYDFDAARSGGKVTYNWYATDADGNLTGPGDDTPRLCRAAIADADVSHVIRHPIDARRYNVACRDYDYWYVDDRERLYNWNSGWITGNWVAWIGGEDSSSLRYAGMCYATRYINDGEVVAWNFNRHAGYPDDDDVDGYTGATRPVRPLRYSHPPNNASVEDGRLDSKTRSMWYTIDGRPVTMPITPGVYIKVDPSTGKEGRKYLVR